jgi:hypothetical protein
LKIAEASRLSAKETEAARRTRADADRALQEARAAAAAGDYLAALAAAKGGPEKVTEEIRILNDAVDARTGRGQRRRR